MKTFIIDMLLQTINEYSQEDDFKELLDSLKCIRRLATGEILDCI